MLDNLKTGLGLLLIVSYGLSTPVGIITALVTGDAVDVVLSSIIPLYGLIITCVAIFG